MTRRVSHFGCTVVETKYGLELTREKYAIINNKSSFVPKFDFLIKENAFTDETGTTYTDEWCNRYQQEILKNYDLNMRYFASLNHDDFHAAIERFLKKNKKFKEVTDLREYEAVSGYYVMVFDKYCQVYVGTTSDIKRRIQSHWSKSKSFDRLLFPMHAVNTSILSVDSFRALDTTRIFVYRTKDIYVKENEYIEDFPPQYVTNRLGGGQLSDNGLLGYLEARSMKRSRELEL